MIIISEIALLWAIQRMSCQLVLSLTGKSIVMISGATLLEKWPWRYLAFPPCLLTRNISSPGKLLVF